MPTKFLHTADLQLGLTRHFLGSDAQPRFAAARNDAIRSIGELAADEGCSFVVACGDVFESNHVSRQVVVRALDALGDVPVPVYLLPGNHDPLDAGSVYRSATFRASVPSNVHVLESGAPVEASPGAWLVAAPWLSKHPLEDLAARSLSDLRELLA
ncbi:MAG: exonuclease SbcCD subunit D, partial [Anaerolineae bacterium]